MYNGSSFLVNPPDIDNRDNLLTCDYNFNDDFCDEEFETNLFLPNVTLKSLLDYYQTTTTTIMTTYTFISRSKTLSSNFFDSRVTTRSMISSISLDNQNISSISDSNTDVLPPLVSPRSKIRSKSKFNIWLIIAPVSALLVCLIILFIGYIKYRRKDVGTYQVEEAQRFRPLIIELQNDQNSPTNNISSSQNHKKKTSKKKKKKRIGVNENKEWYI
ncbi:unnamed protein product [Didymodactylos carnosus]|nr:unnamed protein product [Didymodactylos carnosus]CAF4120600.1 unnamed protein product [Didymodactylos carnosus]